MKKLYRILLLTFTILTILFLPYTPVQAKEPAVHALFFYSQTCPHCHKVVTEDLPPLLEKYPEQLFILGIDTSMAEGYALYEAAIRNFQIPTERMGVPTLIVGETVLVGSLEIPEQFPGIVERVWQMAVLAGRLFQSCRSCWNLKVSWVLMSPMREENLLIQFK